MASRVGVAGWSVGFFLTACSGSAFDVAGIDGGSDATLDATHPHDSATDHVAARDASAERGAGDVAQHPDTGHDTGTVMGDAGHDASPDTGHPDAGVDAHMGGHDSGGGACSPSCGAGFTCCDGQCVNPDNDIRNCGSCGTVCGGAHPFCDVGHCGAPPCAGGVGCSANESCCGTQCCGTGTLCCNVPEGVSAGPMCTMPVNGTCPKGCPACL